MWIEILPNYTLMLKQIGKKSLLVVNEDIYDP